MSLSETHKKILFHFVLWSIWLHLSLSNAPEEEIYERALLIGSLILMTHIPLFVINTEILIPRLLHKKGVNIYFWSLVGTIAVFALLHYTLLDLYFEMMEKVRPKNGFKISKGMVALILVAAISTGYSLVNFVATQEKRQQEKQKEHLQSELSFLRSQISPHFIFNVLNSIVYLIRSKSDLAEPVTLKLSELMRYMLYESESDQIGLDKEISYLKNYIELQKVRFEEDVTIRANLDGDTSGHVIEPMLLIPFVENAFKHGVGMVIDPIINIDLAVKGDALTFTVRNKIAPESIQDKDSSSGIGLKNVQRRLELLYPNTHKMTITQDQEWFEVKLYLSQK